MEELIAGAECGLTSISSSFAGHLSQVCSSAGRSRVLHKSLQVKKHISLPVKSLASILGSIID